MSEWRKILTFNCFHFHQLWIFGHTEVGFVLDEVTVSPDHHKLLPLGAPVHGRHPGLGRQREAVREAGGGEGEEREPAVLPGHGEHVGDGGVPVDARHLGRAHVELCDGERLVIGQEAPGIVQEDGGELTGLDHQRGGQPVTAHSNVKQLAGKRDGDLIHKPRSRFLTLHHFFHLGDCGVLLRSLLLVADLVLVLHILCPDQVDALVSAHQHYPGPGHHSQETSVTSIKLAFPA